MKQFKNKQYKKDRSNNQCCFKIVKQHGIKVIGKMVSIPIVRSGGIVFVNNGIKNTATTKHKLKRAILFICLSLVNINNKKTIRNHKRK